MKGMLARKRQFLEHGTLKIDEDELDRHRLDELQKNQVAQIVKRKQEEGDAVS